MGKTCKIFLLIIVFSGAVAMSGCESKKPKVIVCLGDSLTACGGAGGRYSDYLAKWLDKHTIINKGVNGDTLAGGRARFQTDVLDNSADVVIIALGANDFWQKKRSPGQLKADLEYMVEQANQASVQVVIASCFGDRDLAEEQDVEFSSDRFDYAYAIAKMEAEVVERFGCFYVPNMQIDIKPNGRVPYWADDNHPNEIGNEFVAKRILAELKKALAVAK